MPCQVLLVGLGTAGHSHLRALEQFPQVATVTAVDTDVSRAATFRGAPIAVHATIEEAAASIKPAIVIIATPSATHAEACAEAARLLPAARLLVEKPAATTLADARHLLTGTGGRQPADVSYHMAFSPEVTWGINALRAVPELGRLASAGQFFADPYYDQFGQAQATLHSSWTDSGINALSILTRFAPVTQRRSLRQLGTDRESTYAARLTCRDGDRDIPALLITNWHAFDPAKTTRLRYESGTELLMDHTAMTAYLITDGEVLASFGSDRSVPRREQHLRALYQHWLIEGHPPLPPKPASASTRYSSPS